VSKSDTFGDTATTLIVTCFKLTFWHDSHNPY